LEEDPDVAHNLEQRHRRGFKATQITDVLEEDPDDASNLEEQHRRGFSIKQTTDALEEDPDVAQNPEQRHRRGFKVTQITDVLEEDPDDISSLGPPKRADQGIIKSAQQEGLAVETDKQKLGNFMTLGFQRSCTLHKRSVSHLSEDSMGIAHPTRSKSAGADRMGDAVPWRRSTILGLQRNVHRSKASHLTEEVGDKESGEEEEQEYEPVAGPVAQRFHRKSTPSQANLTGLMLWKQYLDLENHLGM